MLFFVLLLLKKLLKFGAQFFQPKLAWVLVFSDYKLGFWYPQYRVNLSLAGVSRQLLVLVSPGNQVTYLISKDTDLRALFFLKCRLNETKERPSAVFKGIYQSKHLSTCSLTYSFYSTKIPVNWEKKTCSVMVEVQMKINTFKSIFGIWHLLTRVIKKNLTPEKRWGCFTDNTMHV